MRFGADRYPSERRRMRQEPAWREGSHQVPIDRSIVGLLLAAVGLTACENLPYYDESLDLFTRSQYDPEVKAIEEQTPPAGESPVLSAPGEAAIAPIGGGAPLVVAAGIGDARDARAPVLAAADVEGADGNASMVSHDRSFTTASSRARITPPMGLSRSKRVIYGNRGPFQTGTMRTPR
jgi:hypothetical protein